MTADRLALVLATRLGYAFFFGAQASSFVVELWPITVLLLAVAIWSGIVLTRDLRLGSWEMLAVTGCSIALFVSLPLVLSIWGTTSGVAAAVSGGLIVALNLGYLLLLAVAVGSARGYRWPLTGIALLCLWINFGGLLVSSMFLYDAWL